MTPYTWMRHIRDSNLPSSVKLTALTIGLRADRNGQCWPSYQQIADDCGAHRRDIMRRIQQLQERGWLMVTKRSNGHGQLTNIYQLITPVENLGGGDTRPTPPVTPDPLGGDTAPTPQGVTPDPPGRSRYKEVQTNPNIEPVDNPHLAAVLQLVSRQHRLP